MGIKKIKGFEKLRSDWERKYSFMSNEDLFGAYTDQAQGDDHDGCFTANGKAEFDIVQDELVKRLKDLGFLKKDYKIERLTWEAY